MKKFLKIISFVLALIFSVVLLLDVLSLQVLSISKSLVSENNVSVMMEDFNVIDLLKDENGNYTESGKEIVEILKEEGIPLGVIENFGETTPVKTYTKNYVSKVIDYLINNKKLEEITTKDIVYFLENNTTKIVEELKIKKVDGSLELTDSKINLFITNTPKIVSKIENKIPNIKDLINKSIEDKLVKNNNNLDQEIDVVRMIFSEDLSNILKAIFLFSIALIILCRHSIIKVFKWIGIPFVLASIALITTGLLFNVLIVNYKNLIPYAFVDLINNQIDNVKNLFINKGIMCLTLGLLLILINIILYIIVSNQKEDKYLMENGL